MAEVEAEDKREKRVGREKSSRNLFPDSPIGTEQRSEGSFSICVDGGADGRVWRERGEGRGARGGL